MNTHTSPDVREQIEAVVSDWESTAGLSPASLDRMAELARRFAARLAATGITCLEEADLASCHGFVWAVTRRNEPPSVHTAHLRRTTLRAIYRTWRVHSPGLADPTRDLDLPPKTSRAARPLQEDELLLVRATSLGRRRQPLRIAAMVALAEATATTGEIPQVCWDALDLARGTVALPGAPPVLARTGRLTDWGRGVLGRLHAETRPEPDDPVTHRGASVPGEHAGQATTSNVLARLLRDAGLSERDLKPTSIRLWAPATRLQAGGPIEQAATSLGLSSLDATADLLAYRWQDR
jgi:hypothetical protein